MRRDGTCLLTGIMRPTAYGFYLDIDREDIFILDIAHHVADPLVGRRGTLRGHVYGVTRFDVIEVVDPAN